MWMITWDYLLGLLAAQDIFRFIFSFSSLIDLATMPAAKAFTRLVSKNSAVHYSIHFGFVRILRLVRIEGILFHLMPWISQARLRLISLIIGAFVITLMFACAMFILEAPYHSNTIHYTTLNDFIFFSVVTISTVGYGDFSPHKPLAKTIVMIAIVVTLTFLPTQVQKLILALQTPASVIGRIPTENQTYIVISGSILPRQLMFMCRELSQSLTGSATSLLVITPNAVAEYKRVIRSAFLHGCLSVSVLQLDLTSSKIEEYYRSALAVLIVGNTTSQSCAEMKKKPGEAIDVMLRKDDQNTMLRFLDAQRICKSQIPVSVQLNDVASCSLLQTIGAAHMICFQHIKMKLMAKTSANCPGFNTLMINLFCRPSKSEDMFLNDLQDSLPNFSNISLMRLYLRGAKYKFYKLKIPQCFYGVSYLSFIRFLLRHSEIYCVGLYNEACQYWPNPTDYYIGDELRQKLTTRPFAALVAAPSFRAVQQISELETWDKTILRDTNMTVPIRNTTRRVALWKKFSKDNYFAHSSLPKPNTSGIQTVTDIKMAKRLVFKDVTIPLLIACGCPRGISHFLNTLSNNQKTNVVLLSPHPPPNEIYLETVPDLTHFCVWIQGSALNADDLLRAGVLEAQGCVIFSLSHVSWAKDISFSESDTQAILIRRIIQTLKHQAYQSFPEKNLTEQTMTTPYPVCTHPNTPDTLQDAFSDYQPQIFLELKTTQFLHIVDHLPERLTSRIAHPYNEIQSSSWYHDTVLTWSENDFSLQHPAYTSGHVTLEPMLYSISSFGLSVPPYCVNCNILDTFIEGSSYDWFTKSRHVHRSPTSLEPIPQAYLQKSTFGTLFEYLLTEHSKFAFALYRSSCPSSLCEDTPESKQFFIIACPSLNTLLNQGDRVYTVDAFPIHSLWSRMPIHGKKKPKVQSDSSNQQEPCQTPSSNSVQ